MLDVGWVCGRGRYGKRYGLSMVVKRGSCSSQYLPYGTFPLSPRFVSLTEDTLTVPLPAG